MIAPEQARQHLESLGLRWAAEVLGYSPGISPSKHPTYPKMVEQELDGEV